MMGMIENIIKTADKPRAEVLIEVTILEVSRTRMRELGIDLSQYAIGLAFSPDRRADRCGRRIQHAAAVHQRGNAAGRNDVYVAIPIGDHQAARVRSTRRACWRNHSCVAAKAPS